MDGAKQKHSRRQREDYCLKELTKNFPSSLRVERLKGAPRVRVLDILKKSVVYRIQWIHFIIQQSKVLLKLETNVFVISLQQHDMFSIVF